MSFKEALKVHIAQQNKIIEEAQRKINLIKKVSSPRTYLLTFKGSGKKSVLKVKETTGYPYLTLVGTLLAEEFKEPLNHLSVGKNLKSYEIQIRFLNDIEPFDPESIPLLVNWEWLTKEFKDTYFKKE